MKPKQFYTTQLQAGLGVLTETGVLFDLWQEGMKPQDLFQSALDSGYFPNVSARRLRNIVHECFSPRYLSSKDYPANILKRLKGSLSNASLTQILFLFTARANLILSDFVKSVYWNRYASGHDKVSSDDAKQFVVEASQHGQTMRPWSDSTIKRVSTYLTGCCADFGMLEGGRKSNRKIVPYRIMQTTSALLAYDLHFQGAGDNALIAHPDWQLFGLQKEDVRDTLKQLSLKGLLIVQTAGDVTHIGWKYKTWEDLLNVITEG